MRKYRILASYMHYCYLDVEAENADEARELGHEADGGDFTPDGRGDWNIDDITELEITE